MSVIVTIFCGSSYDSLFRSVPQIAPEGRVSVFQLQPSGLPILYTRLNTKEPSNNSIIDEIAKEIESLQPESVVFNWECCSAWSGKNFTRYLPSQYLLDPPRNRKSSPTLSLIFIVTNSLPTAVTHNKQ